MVASKMKTCQSWCTSKHKGISSQ